MRLLPLSLSLALVATTGAQSPPAFTERDRTAAITELCGRVAAGTAKDDSTRPSKTVKGFLTPDKSTIYVELLAAAFVQGGRSKHLIVLGGHGVHDGVIDEIGPARVEIFVGVLEFQSGRWRMASKGSPLTETGFNGRDPVVALRKISGSRHVLDVRSGLWSEGSSQSVLDLYDLGGAVPAPAKLLHVVTAADDCGLSDSCFAFEGTFAIDAKPGAAAYDARLLLNGTYRNADGGISTIPANAPFVFTLKNGRYTPVLSTPARRALWDAVQSPLDR
jgi:hypothetical protein